MNKKVIIIEVQSELGAGTPGASFGIDALKIASIKKRSPFFTKHNKVVVLSDNTPMFKKSTSPTAKHIKKIVELQKRVQIAVAKIIREDAFPLVLAGDHSTSFGTIAGIKHVFPEKRLGVIWIDAHADLHTPYTTPSGNLHGMPLALALAIDNTECMENTPDPDVIHLWKQAKKIGTKDAKINYEDIVYISVRDFEKAEEYLMNTHNIKVFTTDDVRKKGALQVAAMTIEYLSKCDQIYVSFDVDSMDIFFAKGTGTAVIGGITPEEAKILNRELVTHAKTCCWEIAEINPMIDSENKTAEIAFDIIKEVTKKRESQ